MRHRLFQALTALAFTLALVASDAAAIIDSAGKGFV